MPSDDHEIRVVPSVLDRLIDRVPASTHDAMPSRARSAREFRFQVLRDLEYLLNARNPFFDVIDEFPELGKSVIAYGLRDVSSLYVTNDKDQEKLRLAIERAVSVFEPRLTRVTVTSRAVTSAIEKKADGSKGVVTSLQFRVDAQLVVDPAVEPIGFDIDLAVDSRKCEVRGRF